MTRFAWLCSISLFFATWAVRSADAAWNPAAYGELSTLEVLTVGPEEGEHWSKLWLAVLDGQVYIRLGSRAAERLEKNTTAPIVKVRIAGEQFDRVRAEPVPDMADRVSQAMGEKYTSDFLVRLFPHPVTMRLTPE
jgi:hypothetical protein